jgi:hypothetical protein
MSDPSRRSSWGAFLLLAGVFLLGLLLLGAAFVPLGICPFCDEGQARAHFSKGMDAGPSPCSVCDGQGRMTLYARWTIGRNVRSPAGR